MALRSPDLPSATRLADRLALRMLVDTFQPELMDRLLDDAERRERRRRLLPAQLMMYFVLSMWLFGASSYEEVLAKLTGGLPEMFQPAEEVASAAAIARARMRLGTEPLKALWGHVAAKAARREQPGGQRSFIYESVAMEVPDTAANRIAYTPAPVSTPCGGEPQGVAPGDARSTPHTRHESPGTRRAEGPRDARRTLDVWLSSLTDCRQRVAPVAAIAPDRASGVEAVVAQWPHDAFGERTLVVGDGQPISAALWSVLAEAGADQIWRAAGRARAAQPLPAEHRLPDGSFLSTLRPAGPDDRGPRGIAVRVVPYAAALLVTSFLDPAFPAEEITARYERAAQDRADGVGHFAGRIAGPRVVLRSKSPELVRQEIYAMLCTYHAVGHLVSPVHVGARISDGLSAGRNGWSAVGRP